MVLEEHLWRAGFLQQRQVSGTLHVECLWRQQLQLRRQDRIHNSKRVRRPELQVRWGKWIHDSERRWRLELVQPMTRQNEYKSPQQALGLSQIGGLLRSSCCPFASPCLALLPDGRHRGRRRNQIPEVGERVMARKVECLCGRVFHVPSSASDCQCRRCGRTWHEVDFVGAVCCAMFGELANSPKVRGDRRRSKKQTSTGRQTSRPRPERNDRIGSIRSLFKSVCGW